ncbi:unnamed protein product [Symbiodinium microadriaticum]|nr:unnamed protein product [Symbiodinium microadriaticum]
MATCRADLQVAIEINTQSASREGAIPCRLTGNGKYLADATIRSKFFTLMLPWKGNLKGEDTGTAECRPGSLSPTRASHPCGPKAKKYISHMQAARHRRPARRRELEAKLLSLRGVLFTAARLAEEADVVIRDLALTMFPASSRLFRENPYE